MGKMSRNKGKRGEREAAKILSKMLGMEIRRGVQYKGSGDSPDVSGLSAIGLHPEVKRDESTISSRLQKELNTYHAVKCVYKESAYIIFQVGTKPKTNLHQTQGTKTLAIAMNQAISDSDGLLPFVMSRRNRQKWYFIVRECDLNEFVKKIGGP